MVSADSTWNTHDMRIRGSSGRFADVDSSGRLMISGGATVGVAQEDGSEFTPGTSDFAPIGGYREDTPTQLADGEGGAVRLTEDRELIVHVANGATAVTPKFTVIDAASSGNNTLIAAVTSKKIRVLSGLLVASGDVTVRFESGADGSALTGQMSLTAHSGFQIPYCPVGNFETAAGALLNLELDAAVSVDGWLVYVEVD